MARTTKKVMYDNLYERVKNKSFSNPDILAITELNKLATMRNEPEAVKDAICFLIESSLFTTNCSEQERQKNISLLEQYGYM